MPLRRGRTEFFTEHGEVHPIRSSPGYEKGVEEVSHQEREHARQRERYRGVQRERSEVQRPGWARGMTDEQVIRIAREHGRSAYSEGWWQGANLEPGRGEYKYGVRESGVVRFKRGKRHAEPRAKKGARPRFTGYKDLPF